MKSTLTFIYLTILLNTGLFGQSWTVIPYEEISDEGLRIITLYEDADGNIWGGNGYSGRIVRWDGSSWETFNNDVTGLDYDSPSVLEIFQDANGKMWFCSFGDGIATFENGTWTSFNTGNSTIPSNLVSDVVEEADGTLWFTMSKRLVSYDGNTWTSNDIPDVQWNAGGLASMGNGNFFVSMLNGDPVRRFDGNDWEVFDTDNSNIGSNFQYYVEKVDNQTFWFGGPNGRANLYDNGTWIPSADMPGWELGLGDYIIKMGIIAKDDVWFATGGGLFHMDGSVWEEFNTTNSPLTANEVQTVMIASDNRIWCTTENELLIYDPEDPNSTTNLNTNINLKILTNPVSSILNLIIENNGTVLGKNGLITIYNSVGQPVITEKISNLQMEVEVEDLANGTYILEYMDGKNRAVRKFLKQ